MDGSEDLHGDGEARARLDAHYTAAYQELRRLAALVSRRDAHRTLNPTALLHEAWLKLAHSADFEAESPLHFRRIAARAMRQVLVEAARRRGAQKRAGAGDLVDVRMDDLPLGITTSDQLLALDDALKALAQISERRAQVVEARFFGGLTVPEIAQLLGVSEITVQRDWRLARAWLTTALREA